MNTILRGQSLDQNHLQSCRADSRAADPTARDGQRFRELRREVRGPLTLGLSAIALFFVVGGIWSATAPLSGAVIASGIVGPESSRQTVQHLEGGIIREIKVHEGQKVKAGDVLVVLESVRAQAETGARLSRLRVLAAMEARLQAEHAGMDRIDFHHAVLSDREDPEVRAAMQAQVNQFNVRRESLASRVAILEQRIVQLEAQLRGLARQLEGTEQQSAHIVEEIASVQELYEKGLERKPRLLALQREQARLFGAKGELAAEIARTKEAIGETRLQITNLQIERAEEIDSRLSDVIAERSQLEVEMQASLDRLRRTQILAPVAGTVLDLRYKTTGGVIGPGQPILDLVPLGDELVIESRIRPSDIDEIRNGQRAYIVFPSFVQRNLKRIEGTVQRYSPDTLEDERTGQHYYSARVTVDRKHLAEVAPEIELSSGMPAEVFITTQKRTLLEFLLQPFLMTLERAFRES